MKTTHSDKFRITPVFFSLAPQEQVTNDSRIDRQIDSNYRSADVRRAHLPRRVGSAAVREGVVTCRTLYPHDYGIPGALHRLHGAAARRARRDARHRAHLDEREGERTRRVRRRTRRVCRRSPTPLTSAHSPSASRARGRTRRRSPSSSSTPACRRVSARDACGASRVAVADRGATTHFTAA